MNVLRLEASRRDALLAGARRQAVARAALLYTPGDAADCIFAVASGRIKIVRTRAGGSESIVGIRNPGDLFGELTWMSGGARSTSAIALDAGEIWQLDAATFEARLRADGTLAATFARGVAQRLAGLELELTDLAGKSVPGRLVDALGRLGAEHGVRQADGTLQIGLSLTHQDLADIIGTSRETLTRELSVLADVGLLRVANRTIVLLAPQAFPFTQRAAYQTATPERPRRTAR